MFWQHLHKRKFGPNFPKDLCKIHAKVIEEIWVNEKVDGILHSNPHFVSLRMLQIIQLKMDSLETKMRIRLSWIKSVVFVTHLESGTPVKPHQLRLNQSWNCFWSVNCLAVRSSLAQMIHLVGCRNTSNISSSFKNSRFSQETFVLDSIPRLDFKFYRKIIGRLGWRDTLIPRKHSCHDLFNEPLLKKTFEALLRRNSSF